MQIRMSTREEQAVVFLIKQHSVARFCSHDVTTGTTLACRIMDVSMTARHFWRSCSFSLLMLAASQCGDMTFGVYVRRDGMGLSGLGSWDCWSLWIGFWHSEISIITNVSTTTIDA